MKVLGSFLLLGAGLWVRRQVMGTHRARIMAGEELLEALQILERGVYTLGRPLGELAAACARAGAVTAPAWEALGAALACGESFAAAWRGALEQLPPPYGDLLAPLAGTLPTGEGLSLLHQVREDVYRAVGEARQERRERDKLVTALCLSASLMAVLVLL